MLDGLWVHYGGVCLSDVGRPVLDGGHREWSRRITETGGFVYKAFALKGKTLNSKQPINYGKDIGSHTYS